MHSVRNIDRTNVVRRTNIVRRIGFDATAIPKRPAGAGNYILQLVTELGRRAAAGFEPDAGSSPSPITANELHSLERRMDCTQRTLVIFILQHGMDLLPAAVKSASPHLEWVVLPDQHPGLRLAWEQIEFPRLVRKYRLDLLHSPHYTMPWLARSVKSIVTFHDMTFFLFPHLHTRIKRWFFPMAIRLSASRADRIIACSESTRQDAIRLLNIPSVKICTVHEGISPDFHPIQDAVLLESTRQRYRLPEKFFLYVGTVEPRKNLPLLLQSYAQVRQRTDDLCPHTLSPAGNPSIRWPLVIVGQKGWHYEEVYQLVHQLNLKDSVHFTGYVPGADIPVLYNLASIFIYPSLYEGAGLPPLEALACGTPVITTDVSSMPEYVGEAAVLVPPGDSHDPIARAALAGAMLSLAQDPARLQAMARIGPQQAADFTWKRTAQATLSIYDEILNINHDRNDS